MTRDPYADDTSHEDLEPEKREIPTWVFAVAFFSVPFILKFCAGAGL